jgi:hypothetical protein
MPGIYIPRRKVAHKTVWEVFRAPVLVATITTAGLTFALFGNGLWDANLMVGARYAGINRNFLLD